MDKNIFIYWHQGFEKAHPIIRRCLMSWKIHNPTWKIYELSIDNINDYINIGEDIPDFRNKTKTVASVSDVIRIFLLEKYGGCWVDATSYCNYSLDSWLPNYISTDFFAFQVKEDRMLSSWFLYGKKGGYIIKKWKEHIVEYINKVDKIGLEYNEITLKSWQFNKYQSQHYFWFHYIFGDLYINDPYFRVLWNKTKKLPAQVAHCLQSVEFGLEMNNHLKKYIDSQKIPVFKLTHKCDPLQLDSGSILDYLFNRNFTIASYKVSTNNLGDHIQIIANLNLLQKYGMKPTLYIDRDNEIKTLQTFKEKSDKPILLVLNGWHKTNPVEWPPSEHIVPIFLGFHIRLHQSPTLLSEEAIEYYKKHEPIGCRDPHTEILLREKGVSSFESGCLSLTLKNNFRSGGENIYVSSRNRNILKIIPNNINYKYINHYSDTYNFDINMKRAQELLEKYQSAKLVVTTFLHCALPCIAMGVPVIVFYPESFHDINQSDKERFSSLSQLLRIYKFSEIDQVNWNPLSVNVDNLKEDIKKKYEKSLLKTLIHLERK